MILLVQRLFQLLNFAVCGLLIACAGDGACAADQERPNIVWISCEDISAHLGCYGDAQATTPNIDRLASEGVRYAHAYATAGVCAPCRSAIITGMYQPSIGTHHMRCRAKLPDFVKPFPIYLRKGGYYCSNNSKEDYQFVTPEETWDESSSKAHWRRRSDKNQPFFSVFNFGECHESGIANDGKYQRATEGIEKHDPKSLNSFPPYYPDTPKARADWGRYYDVITAMDRRVGEILSQLKEDGLEQNTIVIFWSDHGVGLPRAKRWLYDSGMHVPLIVKVPKKWRQFEPAQTGFTSDRLVSLIDLGPSVLNLAGVQIPSLMQGEPFLGNDLPAARKYVYGARDRMDERYDIIRAVRDHRYKYIRNYEPFKAYYQYMNTPEKGRLMQEIRRVSEADEIAPGVANFLATEKPTEELYDTRFDPHEIKNLANDPKHKAILERMRKAHWEWSGQIKDLGLIPEPELIARESKLGNRFAILRQPGAEGLNQRVLTAADASLSGKERLADMLAATKDSDAAVRYWGATGIGNLAESASDAANRMQELLKDESAVVRVAAARALCRMNRPQHALPVLVETLEHGKQWERLNAIIVLDEIDEMARPVVQQMKAATKPRRDLIYNGKYTVRVANRAVNELLGTNNRVN